MKVFDIHKAFKIQMDKNADSVSYGGCPSFLPEEEDLFLNQAFIEVISNKFTGTNVSQVPFEGSVKRIADLENLVKTDYDISASLDSSSNVLTVENFSGDNSRMFYVDAVLHFGSKQSNCVLISHQDSRKFRKTYSNDPWIDVPVSTLADNKLMVFIDTHTMAEPYSIDITYVSFPPKINYTEPNNNITQVPERVLYEVINRAVVIALENIESKRTETKVQINNLQE